METLTLLKLVLLGLASFRLSHLFVFDEIMNPIRKYFLNYEEEENVLGLTFPVPKPKGRGIRNFIGRILRCYWCTGVWMTLFLIVIDAAWPGPVTYGLMLLLAVSAIQSLIEHWVQTRI